MAVDGEKITLAIQTGVPLTIKTFAYSSQTEEYIAQILLVFLQKLNQEKMFEPLSYCVKELVTNAKKANAKRVYFIEKQLDINDDADYKKGMLTFKEDTFSHIDYYTQELRKRELYIKVVFQLDDNAIKIEIKNNCEMTVFERLRVQEKLEHARKFSAFENELFEVLDESEGSGLGLIIMILVLKKFGFSEKNYAIFCKNGETVNRITIPLAGIAENIDSISKDFAMMIEGLPAFPENIMQINKLISSPTSHIGDIAQKIANDVSLSAELLKMVNSAAYFMGQPCRSISDAVKFVGLRGIRNLLFSIGSMHSLVVKSSEENKKLWDHSYQVAFYSQLFAKNFLKSGVDKTSVEDSYVCGLLHDMGKIVFENIQPDLMKRITQICEQRGIPQQLFESLIAGSGHGEIGALIAENWNFPRILSQVIRYHHKPLKAPDEARTLACVVYICDMMAHFAEGKVDFEQIDTEVLKEFAFDSEEKFTSLSDKLLHKFKND